MTVRKSINAAVGAIVLALGLASPMVAHAVCIDEPCPPSNQSDGSLEWQFKSNHQYEVALKFYSQTRSGHEWPNSRQHYVLDDYKTHTYTLGCMPGEQICYGAWVAGDSSTYWGAGKGGAEGCDNCCYTCGDQTRRKVLGR